MAVLSRTWGGPRATAIAAFALLLAGPNRLLRACQHLEEVGGVVLIDARSLDASPVPVVHSTPQSKMH